MVGMKNPLQEWITANGLSRERVARATGYTLYLISSRSEAIMPGPLFIRDIEKFTEGAITFSDWLAWNIHVVENGIDGRGRTSE